MRVAIRMLMLATVVGTWTIPVGAPVHAGTVPVKAAGWGRAGATSVDVQQLASLAVAHDAGTPHPTLRPSGFNLDGLGQEGPASAPVPDASAAAGPRYLVETVNSRLAAFTRTGTVRCAVTLAALFGTGDDEPTGPRVQYDAVYDRYTLVAGAAPPALLYLATTRGGDPCATWWVYRVRFNGAPFPPGIRLDRPYLAQDPHALLLSSNNYRGPAYSGSTALAAPKAAVYAGVAVDLPAFPVAFSTAPVTATVEGDSYFLAAVPGLGYQLYGLLNSAGPGTVLLDQGMVAAPFLPPPRWARQCTGAGLDPLDGRIAGPAVRVGDYIWFTHGVAVDGRPGVRYGALDLFTNAAYTATAARSATSDDFNPSIGARDAGYGLDYIWLNWAATDPGARPCADVAVVADGVAPGDGVPDRIGTGVVLAQGGATGADAPFGGYSSVAVDPVTRPGCPVGTAAVVAQQYFDGAGRWRTRIARVEWC
jgi:hypothetical protein